MSSFTQQTVKQLALQRFLKEETERKAEEERIAKETTAAAAALREAERLARIRAEQEREEARIRAERALAEEKVKAEAAALEAAVEAELTRLRNRSELEVLRDEVTRLRELVERFTVTQKPSVCAPVPSHQKIYSLSIEANNATLGCDPHYGTGKILKVVYKLGGSIRGNPIAVEEHQTLTLSGPGLEIVSASWETNPNCVSACPNRGRPHMGGFSHPQFFKADVLSSVIAHLKEVA